MKKNVLSLIALTALAAGVHADIVAQWTFNNTNSVNTNSPAPSVGTGTASLLEGTMPASSGGFASGTGSIDTNSPNFAWNTSSYAPPGTSNKLRGVQFAVSTLGYDSIVVAWDQKESTTASKYTRLQYSTDGTNFTDLTVITAPDANFYSVSNNLASVPGVANNSNFAFRIVAEFEATAIGTTNANYVGVAAAYGTGGNIRFDMVTVSGAVSTNINLPPTVTALANQTIRANETSPAQPFTVADWETPVTSLVVTGASGNLTLVPNENISISGTDSNRTVRVTPYGDRTGTATITVTVVDEGGKFSASSFVLTVRPVNTPPTIAGLNPTNTLAGAPAILPFVVGDLDTPAADLVMTGSSGNPELLPDSGIHFNGVGSGSVVTLSPASGKSGVAVVTVTVSDPGLSTTTNFALMVVPSAAVLFNDSFSYADGAITTGSGRLWNTHSGTPGEMPVVAGELEVSSALSEDVNAALMGGPYTSSNGAVLYVKFTANVRALPTTPLGNYFAHFKEMGSSNFRARLFAATATAADGSFRFGIANSTTNFIEFPLDLSPNSTHTVVVRYNVATGQSTLWVNAASESDASVTATDATSLGPVTAWAFRESTGSGIVHVDDLVVAMSFEAAVGNVSPPPQLEVICTGVRCVRISWPASATDYRLVSKGNDFAGDWNECADQGTELDGRRIVNLSEVSGQEFFRLMKK